MNTFSRGRGRRFEKRPHANQGGFKRKRPAFRDLSKFINPAVPKTEERPYSPTHAFADFPIHAHLKRNVAASGYNHPTPIQDQAIPIALKGQDIVGIANTGTGKTAAFLIPLLHKIALDKTQKVLIVAPTRELAIQINQELVKFARGLQIYSVCIVGGMSISRQINDLRRSHQVVIGTPGRLLDLLKRGNLKLKGFQSIVLDEADRMLDMGFIRDVRYLMQAVATPRHTLFFSATLSPEIRHLINEFLHNPSTISVKTRDTSHHIDQNVVYVKNQTKLELLHQLLSKPECKKVLIFGSTKYGVENLSGQLSGRGFKVASLHGNKNHNQRQRALKQFKEDSVNVLVATDVAARGLDIPDVSHVINYELPASYEDYIHRIGRTGRGNKSGKALTFIE